MLTGLNGWSLAGLLACLLACLGVSTHSWAQDYKYVAPEVLISEPVDGIVDPNVLTFEFKIGKNGPQVTSTTQGFNMAVRTLHEPLIGGFYTNLNPGPKLQELNGGDGPDSFVIGGGDCTFIVGVTYSSVGSASLEFNDEGETVVVADYIWEPTSSDPDCDLEGAAAYSMQIIWEQPPQLALGGLPGGFGTNSILVDGVEQTPQFIDGAVSVGITTPFMRGDCDGVDNLSSLPDVLVLLSFLFAEGARPPCEAACDFNGDQALKVSDAVMILNYFFLGGPAPSAPFPDCGEVLGVGPGNGCEAPTANCQ